MRWCHISPPPPITPPDHCLSRLPQSSGIGEPSVYHALVVIFLEFFAWGLLTTPMITVRVWVLAGVPTTEGRPRGQRCLKDRGGGLGRLYHADDHGTCRKGSVERR